MADDTFDRSEFVAYFRDEASELLDRMDADLLALEQAMREGSWDAENVNSLFRSLHTVKGSAGMLDFVIIQRVAHRLENVIELLRSETIPLTDRLLELTFVGRDLLGKLIDRAVGENHESLPEVDEYIGFLEEFVLELQLADENTDTTEDDAIANFQAEIARLLAEHHVVEPPIVVESAQTLAVEVAQTAAESLAEATAALTVTPVSTSELPPTPAKATAHAPATSTIRVDLERLDLLLDLVGELVINRTRISAIAQSLQQAMERDPASALPLAKDLAASSATLARISNELQESVMKARMVPVGQVFERFPRTVRDIAKSLGKQITLVTSGVDTDLDKTIVDQIGEPLMHLVRNCADHGLEMPEVRKASGKNPMGTIRLNAYHEGNQVIIEVSDDGAGISIERVRARAVERGLIDAHMRVSDEEVVNYIFAPGFSTAEAVTGLSGRGVGMDVVRKSVLDLKGQLDVETKAGQGSTFTIRLPLTLAIMRTLLVRVLNRLFAIPLDVVIESQRIPRQQLRTISGSAVISLRGQVVPLVFIHKMFELPATLPLSDYVMVVIVVHKGRHIGLVVDNFEADQEIVIKPLSEIMGDTECIAGATILGNGEIALILDIAALAAGVQRIDGPLVGELHPFAYHDVTEAMQEVLF